MENLSIRQASGSDHEGFESPRIKKEAFLPIIWTFVALSFCFLPIRLYTRWRAFRRFFWDDLLAIIAWLLAVSLGAVATHIRDDMYYIIYLTLGLIPFDEISPQAMDYAHRMARGAVASIMMLYTSLWCIKIGFLLFFYTIGVKSAKTLRWHWWVVLVLTVLCFVGCFPSLPYYCSFGDDDALRSDYCAKEQNLSFISMKVNCALDVFTDALIMSIPFNILWRSRIPIKQKLALAGVFSLVIVTIVVAIVRATVTTTGVTKQMDVPWVLVWTSIEANIAIIVACVGSFRMLFVQHRKDSRPLRNSFKMMDRSPEGRSPERTLGETEGSTWSNDEILVAPWSERGVEIERELGTVPGPMLEVQSNGRVVEVGKV